MSEISEKTVFGHTKGPWIYANRFTESGEKPKITTVCWVGDYVIGVPSDYPGGDYRCGAVSESLESDARLIAQAPELLDALMKMLWFFDGYQGMRFPNEKAIIAKAIGISPVD